MTREAMDLIRDECEVDAFCEPDEDVIEYCDGCNEPVYAGDRAMGFVIPQGNGQAQPFCLCKDCLKELSIGDVLDVLGITYFDNDAERSVPTAWRMAREHNDRMREQFRRVITTAAQMTKGAQA